MNGIIFLPFLLGVAIAYSDLFIGSFKVTKVEEDVPTAFGPELIGSIYKVSRGHTAEDLFLVTPGNTKFHIFLNKHQELTNFGMFNDIDTYGEEITPTSLHLKYDQTVFELEVDRKNLIIVSNDDGNSTVITAKRI